jgi:hypothetical protein
VEYLGGTQGVTILMAVAGAAAGALLWWATREAAAGRLARGSTMGIRVARTLSSDEAWRRGHEVALPWTLAGRYVAGLLGVGALVAMGMGHTTPAGLALAIAGLLSALITPFVAAAAIARTS